MRERQAGRAENVNIYPLIAKILGLRIGEVDGDVNVLQSILKMLQSSGRIEGNPQKRTTIPLDSR